MVGREAGGGGEGGLRNSPSAHRVSAATLEKGAAERGCEVEDGGRG